MIWYCQLGLVEYPRARDLQNRLQSLRTEGGIGDVLLFLEHPPTLTYKRSKDLAHLVFPEKELIRKGISLHPTDRGGSITWHGPGQLVVYPILDLNRRGGDIHQYVFKLQEVIIRTLKDFNLTAGRDQRHVGVWVEGDKIAALGLNVKKGITKHGFALNVNNNLEHFSFIHPCGLVDRGVTSMSKLLGREVVMDELTKTIIAHFVDVFGVTVERSDHIMGLMLPDSHEVNGFSGKSQMENQAPL